MKFSFRAYRQLFAACLIATCIVSLPIAPAGCKSAIKTSYKVSTATHISATTALRGWNEYLGQKDRELTALALTDSAKAAKQRAGIAAQVAQVKAAYEKYQATQIALLNAAQQFALVPTGTNAPSQVTIDAAIAASSATLAELVNLITLFGVKI